MYTNEIYCGSAECNGVIRDQDLHYSSGLKKAFHYKRGCAFDAAEDFVGNHSFEIRQRWDFISESDDEELNFD